MSLVAERFAKLLLRVVPLTSEVDAAKTRFGGIRTRLGKSFSVSRTALFGSHAKGTAIRSASDVDVLVVLRRDEIRWGQGLVSSTTLLNNIRVALADRYTATDVGRDGQAVVARFGRGAHAVDVVPAVFVGPGKQSGHPVYQIPDGNGGWLQTSPDAQLALLNAAHLRAGRKLKPVARLVKWWSVSRSPAIPIKSVHVEALMITKGIGPAASYATVLRDLFAMLKARKGAPIDDPTGISGRLALAATEAQRAKVLDAISYAADHAERAVEAEMNGRPSEAVRQWQIVFNNTFPAR